MTDLGGVGWCEMSDLPQDQCGLPCCKAPPPREERAPATGFRTSGQAPVTRATSYSTCDECGQRIKPDDLITKTDDYDYWIHEVCP